MMLKRVDFYVADRAMSERVVEFMRCKVWKKEIQLTYGKKIDDLRTGIEKLDVLKGSIHEDKIPEMRTTYMAQIAELETERDKQIELEAKFELSENDKNFKKSLRKIQGASDLVAEEVVKWFSAYHLDVSDSYFLDEILQQFGSKFDFRTLVTTNGTDARTLDVNRALEMVYATAYTHMVKVGTIKANQIPELVREKYAPKKKDRKSK